MGTLFSAEARKAWLAAVTALVGALVVGAQDQVLTLVEYLTATSAALVALGGVYGVRNADSK